MENKLTPGQDDDLLFQFRSKTVSEEKRAQNWKGIEKGIEKKKLLALRRRRIFFSVLVILILALGALWLFYIKTNYYKPAIIFFAVAIKTAL
ncbi:MAG TPA: hypothetical protein PLP23_10515 [Panacibacter sp.]|nr:hypothetical protein [Panacibacter sp.]